MRRKLTSMLGVMVLAGVLCSAVGITAFASKAVSEGASITEEALEASPSEADPSEPSEEESSEEETEDNTQENTQDETKAAETEAGIEDKQQVKARLAEATPMEAEFIPAEDVVWEVGENGYKGQDCPGWGKWSKNQLTEEETRKVKRTITEVYRDGENLGTWNSNYTQEMDFRRFFNTAGDYQFRVTYNLKNRWELPEDDALWSEMSDTYTYNPPTEKVAAPEADSLEWKSDGTMTWKAVTWKGNEAYPAANGRYIVYIEAKESKDAEFVEWDVTAVRNNTCSDLAAFLEPGYTYRYRVCALGDLISYANSDLSGYSKEFSMDNNAEKGQGIIDNIMNQDDIQAAVESANLSKDEKDALKLAVQNNPSLEESYLGLEEEYKSRTGKPDLEVETGDSGVDGASVSVVGGTLNGANKLTIAKPTAEELGKVEEYRRYAAVNISLDVSNADLKFPVLITMPVPEGINPQQFILIHIKHDGTKETLQPRINEDSTPATATFAVNEFSVFLFVDTDSSDHNSDGSTGGSSSSSKAVYTKPAIPPTPGQWKTLEGGKWQFVRADGMVYANTWIYVNAKWYWMDAAGVMAEGWQTINKRRFYLKPVDGAMATGWLLHDSKWYYLDETGAMKTGWISVNGKQYYLGTDGVMLANTVTPDGFAVDASGATAE